MGHVAFGDHGIDAHRQVGSVLLNRSDGKHCNTAGHVAGLEVGPTQFSPVVNAHFSESYR